MMRDKINRSSTINLFKERGVLSQHQQIAEKSDSYRIPKGYLKWGKIKDILALALWTYEKDTVFLDNGITAVRHDDTLDYVAYFFSYDMALWFVNSTPVYLVSKELLKAFNQTRILDKADLLKQIESPLPALMLLFPENSFKSTDGVIDHVVIRFTKALSPGSALGERHGIKVLSLPQEDTLHIDWSCMDTQGTVWHGGLGVTDGEVSLSHRIFEPQNYLRTGKQDELFVDKMQNIVLQTLLCTCLDPELITDCDDTLISASKKSFSPKSKTQSNQSDYLLPRYLGKNYRH